MKNILKSLLVMILLLSSSKIFSQTLTFSDVKKTYANSVGTIVQNKEIIGYYYLYKLDKVDKVNSLFKLVITDASLNIVAQKEIVENKKSYIAEACFNGTALAIKYFVMEKEEYQMIKFYDLKANEIGAKKLPFDKDAYSQLGLMRLDESNEIETSELVGINNKGFVNFLPVLPEEGKSKKVGVKVQYFPMPVGDSKEWSYTSPQDIIEIPTYLGNNGNILFSAMLKKDKLLSKDYEFSLAAFDIVAGKKIYNKEFVDAQYSLDVVSVSTLEDKNILFGNLNELNTKNDKKTKSLGMFAATIDDKGNIVNRKDILWNKFAKDFAPKDEKGNPEEIGSIYIHKIVKSIDGKIFAIGERFDKVASASAIIGTLMGGSPTSQSYVDIKIMELVVIEFDNDFNPLSVKFYDKGRNKVNLPPGAGMFGSTILGMFLKQYNAFDYAYTQEANDASRFTICYSARIDKKGYFKSITYNEGTITEDQVPYKQDGVYMRVAPAKLGYVLLTSYNRKEKKSELRLEKIN